VEENTRHILNIIAYIVSVAASIATLLQFLIRDHYVHLHLKGLLKRRLIFSSARILREIEKLADQIKKGPNAFAPHVVIGIGGRTTGGSPRFGGAIVALHLASARHLNTTALYLDYLRTEKGLGNDRLLIDAANNNTCNAVASGIVITIPARDVTGRILVVDDWSKTGETISDVVEKLESALKQQAPQMTFSIQVAAVVRAKIQTNLKGGRDWEKTFRFRRYLSNLQVEFPWHA